MSRVKIVGYIIAASVVCLAGLIIINVASTKSGIPVAQPSVSTPVTPADRPTGTTSGRGGVKPSLPISFPADVPLPAGTMFGSSGASPSWSIGFNIDGSASIVMPKIRAFYVAHGFTDLNPDRVIPFGFENAKYSLQIAGQDHDHVGPQSTDLTILVHQK